ncbi:MAG: dihydrolipoyl dehydrogenase [Acidobacteriia bacterium]|nr:dihydrolipoyl dehydrogenase [Terriglobia bacterium]
MFDLIVIGAGPGGYEAAAHAGRMGKRVALIEKDRLGGTCLNVGCIPAKSFLRSSKLFHECREASAYGIRVDAPEFDMAAVMRRKNRIVATLTHGVQGILKRAGVQIITGQAKLVSRNAVEVAGARYESGNILLATGSRPAIPPIPGILSASALDSNTVFALQRVPERIAIIGGGYIGLEFSCFFNEIGTHVTVFELLPQIASGCDGEISLRLLQILKAKGIEFHLSTKVVQIEGPTLHYTSGEGAESSTSNDYILNATGRVPVVNELGLESLAVDFDAKGVKTSDQGKTNVPGIWACGDVTGRRMLAHAATREGIVAVNNMFGIKDRMCYVALPAVAYTHPEVSSVGRTEEDLQSEGIDYKKSVVPMTTAGRFLIEHEDAVGIVKVLSGTRFGEILGVHAIGDGSSEFIVAAAMMVGTEMRASDVSEIIFPHPTVSEALREAVARVR